MSYSYYIIDAFTESAFGGVPVAVFPDTVNIPESRFATLADEMVASDTAFISQGHADGQFQVRAFHKGKEVSPGAHTLIASVEGLLKTGQVPLTDEKATLTLGSQEESITVFVDLNQKKHPILLHQTVSTHIDHYVPSVAEVASIIGLEESDIAKTRYSTLIVSSGKPYLIVPLMSYHAVREATFQQRDWARTSLPQSLVDSILLFAPNTDSLGDDFHARLLEQNAGHADPAIGEAMPAFAAYLCQQSHVQLGRHAFSVRRGANNKRQSHIHMEMDNTGEEKFKLRIGGSAIATSSAELLFDLSA